jgi:1-acyl-sn-glycerol-3-phosphate acyltransferase
MRNTLRVYYKRIIIEGIDNLPKDGPVILASNHPNSFLDACIIGCFLPRRLHFITRGDVFNSPMKQWILGKLQMIPIYRLQEGIENLEKNKETFKRSEEVLNNGGVINIYSEGICVQEKRLRKLKKGTARMALDYVSEMNKPLPVVALGINYMEPMRFRKEVIMGITTSFDAAQIKPTFNENPAQSIIAFNHVLTEKLREVVIHIADKNKEKHIDQLILAQRKQKNIPPGLIKDTGILKELIAYTEQLNSTEQLPEVKKEKPVQVSITQKLILQLIALPGIILNGLPVYGAWKLTTSKVKLKEFKDSVLVAGSMIFYILYSIVIIITLGILNPIMIIPVFAVMLIMLKISVWCYDHWTNEK